MNEVVRSVTLKTFNPAKYPNPALQWHYRILQAIALEEELPEKADDKTVPKYSAIHKRVGPLALEWVEELDKEDYEPTGGQASKRKAISSRNEDGPVDKKVKREKKSVEPTSSDKIESLFEQGTLMTVWLSVDGY
jgi:ATP-dependent DNA helicase 2 subunit 1